MMDPFDSFLFLITPPLKSISNNGSFPLFNKFSTSKAFDRADALTSGLACFPFQTNIIYSKLIFKSLRCGIRNDSNYSELATGHPNPRGVKFEYDSTNPHI